MNADPKYLVIAWRDGPGGGPGKWIVYDWGTSRKRMRTAFNRARGTFRLVRLVHVEKIAQEWIAMRMPLELGDAARDHRAMREWVAEHYPGRGITVVREHIGDCDLFSVRGPAGSVNITAGNELDVVDENDPLDLFFPCSTFVMFGSIGTAEDQEEFNHLENALRRACEIVISGTFQQGQ